MKKALNNLKWLYKNTNTSIYYLIGLILIGSTLSILSVSQAMVGKSLIDSSSNENSSIMFKWLIVLASVLIAQVLLRGLQTILSTYFSTVLKNNLQSKLYNHILKSKWLDLSKFHSVDLLTRTSNDVSTIVSLIVDTLPQIISLSVMLVAAFFALLTIAPTMAFVAIAIFPFLILLSKLYGKKLKYFYIALQKQESKYSSFVQESFNNILIIKSFCLERNKESTLHLLQKNRLDLTLKKSYFSAISNGLLSFSSYLGYFFVFSWGALNLSSGISTFGNLTAMIQLFSSIQAPIYGLSSAFPQFISALGAVDRLREIEAIPLESIKLKLEVESYNQSSITFKNVDFGYIDQAKVLKDISFTIKSNEIIGLVGPSGEGKTTLIRLLLSLIKPTNGNILIDNEILNNSHRDLLSYVPQGNTLFSGSILENLKFGNPEATADDISDALKISQSFNFVSSFKDGVDTIIGEKGIGISEGQAQRLTLARAFLRKKPILILDEATSSLDGETEVNILKEIRNLDYNPICIIITHRPSALSICSKVYKLENTQLSTVPLNVYKESFLTFI